MEALTLFVQSLKSPYTQKTYTYHLNKFCNATKLDYDKLLHTDAKTIETLIIEYLISLKKEGKSHNSRQLALAAIKHFLSINDVVINGAKVNRFLGERGKTVKDRPYTHAEIAQMLTKCDERKRVIVLLLASSGMRIGALPHLKLRHLEKREKTNIYKINAYYGTKDEYVTFCSFECARAIDSYLQFRERYGEKLTPESPLVRDQFDRNDPFHSAKARHVAINTLTNLMFRVLADSGFRLNSTVEGQEYKRKEVMANHGMRKFFATSLNGAIKNPLMVDLLLGHETGLHGVYTKPSDEDKEAEYVRGMDSITISVENRLKVKLDVTTKERDSALELANKRLQEQEERNKRLEAKQDLFDELLKHPEKLRKLLEEV